MTLRLASRNSPFASSRTCPSSTVVLGEHKVVEVLEHGEFGAADPIVDRAGLTVRDLGTQEAGEQRIVPLPCQSLAGDLIKTRPHSVELQARDGFYDLVAFHRASSFRRSQGVVASAIGDRLIASFKASGVVMLGGGGGCRRRARIAMDDVAVCDAGRERLDTRLARRQTARPGARSRAF